MNFKIVEIYKGGYRTLFHGNFGSRHLPLNIWLKADVKPVSDGGRKYTSGWHSFSSRDTAESYLCKFKTRKEKLRIVPVEVSNVRKKPTNNDVVLSEFIRLVEEE